MASVDTVLSRRLQHALHSLSFRVYVNDDLVGVELAAASKNVIALAAGGSDGLGLGDNAKSAVITARARRDVPPLGEACGGRAETFSGLAGLGDLVATCWSTLSRNRRAGELLAQGMPPDQVVGEIGSVVEGFTPPRRWRASHNATASRCRLPTGYVTSSRRTEDRGNWCQLLMGRQPTEE